MLDAEARIGELIKDINPNSQRDELGHKKKSLPEGITHNQSQQFQTLAENKDVIEKCDRSHDLSKQKSHIRRQTI